MNKKISIKNFIFFLFIFNLSVILIFIGLDLLSRDIDVQDSSAADNNCCEGPNCENYNGDFVAGYNACVKGECAKCAGGAKGGCNKNRICEAGENDKNCPSDCDKGGFSELGIGASCNVYERDKGWDQCKGSEGLKCVGCPPGTANSGPNGLCTTKYSSYTNSSVTANSQFINQFCITPTYEEPVIVDIGKCKPIDSDSNSKLELVDLASFASNFNVKCSNSNEVISSTCGSQDVNNDGLVNLVDLSKFALFFEKPSCKEIKL